ncbi:hypothetical protein ZHAS_00002286 [Anopheles sinensis]|uniref:Thioredoxin domain-containing protein n=1 Tax=Anopheles sinensis TaxID=74873 RepID=A0A084VC24_ANOSI|nr:hypothetical protein ZHAS_00002286 [Anopheles sinensis]
MLRIFRNTLLDKRIIRKTFSFSAVAAKRFVIKDHYEFDQKVNKQTGNQTNNTGGCVFRYPFKPARTSCHFSPVPQVINSDNPVIVNFHAEWCDPCKILTPKMTELLEPSEEIDLAIVDVDDNAELVQTFEVKAVPAILAFRNGVVVDKFIGLVDANMIENLIGKLKKKKAA